MYGRDLKVKTLQSGTLQEQMQKVLLMNLKRSTGLCAGKALTCAKSSKKKS